MTDLHIHTHASHDAQGSVIQFCKSAIEKGIKIIGITNHLDLDPSLEHCGEYNHKAVLEEVELARRNFDDTLKILIGVEVSYQPEYENEIAKTLDAIKVDYIMGSVHMLGGADYIITEENGARNLFRNKSDPREVFEAYFQEVWRAVKFGYFDVLGHLDVIKRFGETLFHPLRPNEYYGEIRRIIEGIIKREMALEVNTSGLYHPVREIYPSSYILKLYKELGGTMLTLGSDAHNPRDVARGFEQALKVITLEKFSRFTIFENRIPKQVQL